MPSQAGMLVRWGGFAKIGVLERFYFAVGIAAGKAVIGGDTDCVEIDAVGGFPAAEQFRCHIAGGAVSSGCKLIHSSD